MDKTEQQAAIITAALQQRVTNYAELAVVTGEADGDFDLIMTHILADKPTLETRWTQTRVKRYNYVADMYDKYKANVCILNEAY